MKIIKLIFILILALFLFSCADEESLETEKSDSVTVEDPVNVPEDETPPEVSEPAEDEPEEEQPIEEEPVIDDTKPVIPDEIEKDMVINISGKPEKSLCFFGGLVSAQPIDDGSLSQIGNHFTGFMDENGYNIPGEFDSDEYSEIFYSGTCDNELYGGTGEYSISGIVKNSDPVKNINPLTDVRSQVARDLELNGFGDPEENLIEAESLIIDYLGAPATEKRFTAMSLENDSTGDAISLWFSLLTLYENSDAQQADFMRRFSTAVIDNDLDYRSGMMDTYSQIPIFDVIRNLKTSYGELTKIPPVWNLGFHPFYFKDLIENEHTLTGSINLESTSGCNISSPYKTYAVPRTLGMWIEDSKYFASNLDGETFSFWTRGFDEYDRPGVKLMDVERMEGISLNGPVNLAFNGILGDHDLIGGQEVYIVVSRDEPWYLTKGCGADLFPWGRLLASDDGGQTWIGWNIVAPFFRRASSDYGMN